MTLARRRSKEQKARAAEKAQRARAEAARRRRRRRAAAPPEPTAAPPEPTERITVEAAIQEMVNYLSLPCHKHEDCRGNQELARVCAKSDDLQLWWSRRFEVDTELRHALEVHLGVRSDRPRRVGERTAGQEFWDLVGKAYRARST